MPRLKKRMSPTEQSFYDEYCAAYGKQMTIANICDATGRKRDFVKAWVQDLDRVQLSEKRYTYRTMDVAAKMSRCMVG